MERVILDGEDRIYYIGKTCYVVRGDPEIAVSVLPTKLQYYNEQDVITILNYECNIFANDLPI